MICPIESNGDVMFKRAIIIIFILMLSFITLQGQVQADDPEEPMVEITSPKEGEELFNPIKIKGSCRNEKRSLFTVLTKDSQFRST